jgi:hypothetical protein
MIRRSLLLGAAAIVFAVMVVLNLAILDVVSIDELHGSLGKIAGVVAVSTVALVSVALLVRAAARR